jgi:hypothetical protein
MDPSVFGTGSIVLNKANSALNAMSVGSKTVPGYGNSGFVTQNGLGQVEPTSWFLQLSWALPTGSPADFPMILSYNSNAGGSTEFGNNWGAPYHRSVEPLSTVNVLTPQGVYIYDNPDANNNYAGSPNDLNNTLKSLQ